MREAHVIIGRFSRQRRSLRVRSARRLLATLAVMQIFAAETSCLALDAVATEAAGPAPAGQTQTHTEGAPATTTAAGRESTGPKPYSDVEVLYATNRVAQKLQGPREGYGTGQADSISYGQAVVSVPAAHQFGAVEMPPTSILEQRLKMPRRPRYLSLQFGLQSVRPVQDAQAWPQIQSPPPPDTTPASVLLFVPSRSSFNDTAFRAAQLAYDFRIMGRVIFFSWNSSGDNLDYIRDLEAAERAAAGFSSVLQQVATRAPGSIDVVVHGMGAIAVIAGLKAGTYSAPGTNGPQPALADRLRNLVFIEPDIDSDQFQNFARMRWLFPKAKITVYSNAEARDMRLSEAFHSSPRMGGSHGGDVATEGFDHIIIKQRPTTYAVREREALLQDIDRLISTGLPPTHRRLHQLSGPNGVYWELE